MGLWVVGVCLAIIASLCGTVGKQLLRFSELQRQKSTAKQDLYAKAAKCARFSGLSMNALLGPLVDMASYAFAAQSLIAPFGGLDIVWNTMLAPFTLKETLTRSRLIGAMLVAIGTSVSVVFGVHDEKEYTREYLEEVLISLRVGAYLVILFGFIGCNIAFFSRLEPRTRLRGLSLGITAGTIAGNMFCVKATAEMLKLLFTGKEPEVWLHWLPYVTLLGAIFFAVTNLKFMDRGMAEFEALFMATLFEGSMIVSGSISGAVVLREFDHAEVWQIGGYCASVSVIVAGISTLYCGEALKEDMRDSDQVTDVEDTEDSPSHRQKEKVSKIVPLDTIKQVSENRAV